MHTPATIRVQQIGQEWQVLRSDRGMLTRWQYVKHFRSQARAEAFAAICRTFGWTDALV